MLEFKNVVLPATADGTPASFSLVISPGEVACLCGDTGKGKTELVQAVMGLVRLPGGYITIDGELVTCGSSEYFRRQIAYVPQLLPDVRMKVSELCQSFFQFKVNAPLTFSEERLMTEWGQLGLDSALWNQWMADLTREQLWLVLLSLTPLLARPILLLDNPVQTPVVDAFIARMAAEGKEVLYTCQQNALHCSKVVTL